MQLHRISKERGEHRILRTDEAEEPRRDTGPDEDEHHPRGDGEADRHGSLREEKQ